MMQIPSLGKLLILVLVIAGVWLFYKLRGRAPSTGQGRQSGIRAQESVALVQCPACQAWHPAQGGCSCGRS